MARTRNSDAPLSGAVRAGQPGVSKSTVDPSKLLIRPTPGVAPVCRMAPLGVRTLLSCAALNCAGANVRGKLRENGCRPLRSVLVNHSGDHFGQHHDSQCKIRDARGFQCSDCITDGGARFVKSRRDAAVLDLIRGGKHLNVQIMKRFFTHGVPSCMSAGE